MIAWPLKPLRPRALPSSVTSGTPGATSLTVIILSAALSRTGLIATLICSCGASSDSEKPWNWTPPIVHFPDALAMYPSVYRYTDANLGERRQARRHLKTNVVHLR